MVICFCASNDDSPFACNSNSTCEVNGYCYSSLQVIYDEQDRPIDLRRSAGCLYNNESGLLLCKTKLAKLNYTCCKDEDLCNKAAYLAKADLRAIISGLQGPDEEITGFLLILSIVLIFVVASLALLSVCQSKRIHRRQKRNQCECMESNNLLFVGDLEERRLDHKKNHRRDRKRSRKSNHRSPSGGRLESEKLTLFDELTFQKELSSGRFLSKHQARRHEMDVFVKIYKGERAKRLWLNEVNIYKIILIRHEMILNFIAKSEFYDTALNETHYLTVTGYHPLGSLESFLRTRPALSEQTMLGLMLSASSGLNHLHLEISSNQRKASIVHRNINAKNFIVKQNLTCALANFNHAIKSTELHSIGCECNARNSKAKTTLKRKASFRRSEEPMRSCEKICKESVRDEKKSAKPCKHCKNLTICKIVSEPLVYCPPEYLDNSINLKSIVSLKSADTYSFGLVLWQIANYFYTGAYRVPFCRQPSVDRHSDIENVRSHGEATCQEAYRAVGKNAYSDKRDFKAASEDEEQAKKTSNLELKRLKYLLLERKPNDDLSIEEMFACHEQPASSSPNLSDRLRSTKSEFMIDEADGLKVSPSISANASLKAHQSETKSDFDDAKVSQIEQTDKESGELKEINKPGTSDGQHLPTKSELLMELLRIIRESTYTEPLSRLSIRKIESDLNRLHSEMG